MCSCAAPGSKGHLAASQPFGRALQCITIVLLYRSVGTPQHGAYQSSWPPVPRHDFQRESGRSAVAGQAGEKRNHAPPLQLRSQAPDSNTRCESRNPARHMARRRAACVRAHNRQSIRRSLSKSPQTDHSHAAPDDRDCAAFIPPFGRGRTGRHQTTPLPADR